MKNLLTVFAFVTALFLGMNDVNAQSLTQDQDRPEVIAKQKVADLSTTLALTGDQQRTLFRHYASHLSNMKKHVDGKSATDPTVIANKKKYDEVFVAGVKKALTPAQFTKWSAMQDQ